MTFIDMEQRSFSRPLARYSYLSVVHAGLTAHKYAFAREAILTWLAHYPGDLYAGLCYAEALVGEGRFSQALQVLQGLCMADPEFLEAAALLFKIHTRIPETRHSEKEARTQLAVDRPNSARKVFAPGAEVLSYQAALSGVQPAGPGASPWANKIYLARQALERTQLEQAQGLIREALSLQALHPLAAVTHLNYLSAATKVSQDNRLKIAARYQSAWPDCLACSLVYADLLMELGDSGKAVTLLHQVASRDVGGQVVRRLWGEDHPYLPLWPERMELAFQLAVPAEVLKILGWNQLPEAARVQVKAVVEEIPVDLPWEEEVETPSPVELYLLEEEPAASPPPVVDELPAIQEDEHPQYPEAAVEEPETKRVEPEVPEIKREKLEEPAGVEAKARSEDLLLMQVELERLASRFHIHGLTKQDGRFPVYVIFSVRSRLETVYGAQIADLIQVEMERLAHAVQKSRRWGGLVFLADDPERCGFADITPAKKMDAWDLKLALKDLDVSMAKRGEMIGALLLVGGPEIIPFHHLPNPVDDQDEDVPSDNPYATRDENYFVPEWPVGRLPGGSGGDATMLLGALRGMEAYHSTQNRRLPWYAAWTRKIFGWMRPKKHDRKSSFGYTAAVWRQAAENVYRIIGEPRLLNVSPPLGLDGNQSLVSSSNGRNKQVPIPRGRLAYFNLHGMIDAPDWYGQRDPLDPSDGPDYPVALRPQDINANGRNTRSLPRVVFSEACYGSHILGRTVDDAISLKFLEAGALAVSGSTCMAYGSIDTPLVAADLLGYTFWKNFQSGLPCGEALSQAKIHLANVMHKRQGYLDGEDQKTLISFVLYGDPLVSSETISMLPKSYRRSAESQPEVMLICDRAQEDGDSQEIPGDVMASVKQVVSQYLPGMANARIQYSQEKSVCGGKGHACPTNQLGLDSENETLSQATAGAGQAKSAGSEYPEQEHPSRRLVVLSKYIPNTHGVHAQVARLTLDEDSKLVKLVVSR